MSGKANTFVLTGTSPAAAGTAIVGKPVGGLEEYDRFTVSAQLVGATGGTLDVYVQRKIATDEWQDWIHFPQLLAGAAAIKYAVADNSSAVAPVACGTTNDAGTVGAPALAANTVAPGHPGSLIRILAVAGVATSAGAVVKVSVEGIRANW